MHSFNSIVAQQVAEAVSAFRQQKRRHAPMRAATPDCDMSTPMPVNKHQLRVLVADDYADTADSLSMLVKAWGHQVWVARDGPAALAMASACQANVLLLDIGLPEMDGCQVARRLRRQERFEHALLIAITGWADQAHRLLGERAGFDLYLIKPVPPSTLEVLLALERDRLAKSSAAFPGSFGWRESFAFAAPTPTMELSERWLRDSSLHVVG